MKKILLIAATVCVIVGIYWASPYREAQRQPVVQLIRPEVNTIQDTVTLQGNIVDPYRKKLYASGASRVLEICVSQGEAVKNGQLLMRLQRTEDMQSEQSAAASALVELKDTLESGAFSEAETMLESIIDHTSVSERASAGKQVYELYSPCDGMVMEISAHSGDEISGLLPCMEITDLKELQIEATAGEGVIGLLKPQMTCRISVPAFSLEGLRGTIWQIAPYAQETGILTGTTATETTVYITPENAEEDLRPGYRASAKVIVSVRENAILLPYEAITQDEAGNEYVLKVEDGQIVKKNIVTGAELESTVEICSGVEPGDLIISQPSSEWEGEQITVAVP